MPASPLPQPDAHPETVLRRLNAGYVQAFLQSDADWYDRHLADGFRCILANGEVMDRAAFLEDAAQPVTVRSFEVDEVDVDFEGDVAIVRARTRCEHADGRRSRTRYTDLWSYRNGRWQAIAAQITAIEGA